MTTFSLKGANDLELFARLYEVPSPQASLVLVHGVGEHAGRFDHVAQFFADSGIAVLSYDHRGAGKSPGKRGHIDSWDDFRGDLRAAAEHLGELYPTAPLFIYGHSMGGAIVLEYGVMTDAPPRGIIASSPSLGSGDVSPIKVILAKLMSLVYPKFTQDLGLDTGNLSRVDGVEAAYHADPLVQGKATARWGAEMMHAHERILGNAHDFPCPVLLAHGSADHIAPIEPVKQFFEDLGTRDKTLEVFEGGYHELHNDSCRDEVLTLFRDWILSRV